MSPNAGVATAPAGHRRKRAARAVARLAIRLVPIWLGIALVTLVTFATGDAAPLPGAQERAAVAAAAKSGRPEPGVTLAVSSLYTVSVPPGTWVPLSVSVTNRGASEVDGNIVVAAPAAQAGLSTPGCLSNGPSTFTCLGAEDYSANTQPREFHPPSRTTLVTYKVPLQLAGGTAKQMPLYVLAGPAGEGVSARVQEATGRVLARAAAQLPVAYGLAQPAVLVVTDNPPPVDVLAKLLTPTGAQPQLQYITPQALPPMAAALGAFRAVAIEQADTTELSPAQGQALEGYVQAGGTLVVAGGLDWREATAGLPVGLLPGRPTGTVSALALPELASLLGTGPVPQGVNVDTLVPAAGSREIMAQGRTPLALEQTRGGGHVVLCAFDPAAAPLTAWPGTPSLLSRLFAPAYQPGYYDTPLPYAEAGGVFPVPPQSGPASVVAKLGGDFDTGSALMSPGTAVSVLSAYLGQAPAVTRPPAVTSLGVLLLGYISVVTLVLVVVLGRARRRAVVWGVVPTLAITGVVAAGLAGIGTGNGSLVEEVRVSQLPAGGHVAQVVSMGMVQLPHGGSRRVELANPPSDARAEAGSPALVGNLAAGTGAEVTLGPGPDPLTTSITVRGPSKSRGGWSASETVDLAGSVGVRVDQSGDYLLGTVQNKFKVKLSDAQIVVGSGEASADLGTLAPGRSAHFEVYVAPNSSPLAQAFGAPAPVVADQPGSGQPGSGQPGSAQPGSGQPGSGAAGPGPTAPASSSTGAATAGRAPAARRGPRSTMAPRVAARAAASGAAQLEVQTALGDLAASYSTEQGGAPVFVAMAAHKLFPLDAHGAQNPVVTDVVIVPLTEGQGGHEFPTDLPGQLVGSSGVTGETDYAITTGSLTLRAGGAFDYEFLLPGARWRRLELDLGSSSGETYGPPLVQLETYNYATGHWDTLQVKARSGELLARVPDVTHHVGPGGTLEVRVVAAQNGVEVYGGFPTLSAIPAGPAPVKPVNPAGHVSSGPFAITALGHGVDSSRAAGPVPGWPVPNGAGLVRSSLAHTAPVP
ncbi:MAG TPA: hypothetical protein VMF65_14300 [Acidimicrobiales bacterium]|nr:hypothetical protein [Acidimicrobiales bacterium]